MKIHNIKRTDIVIPKNRQRREFNSDALVQLAGSIAEIGLIQPVVIRRDAEDQLILVAGERRIRAMEYVWNFGNSVDCGEYTFKEGEVPCLFVGELTKIEAYRMELEENVRRSDLTWQEKCSATQRLADMEAEIAGEKGQEAPTNKQLSEKITGNVHNADMVRRQLIVAQHLDDPDIAKAATTDDAYKILKRKEATQANVRLAALVGANLSALSHTLHHGDCFEILEATDKETFDVICTDPPYGIDADQFNDSGGMAPVGHFYKDDWTTWHKLIQTLSTALFRVAKPNAHLYLFCDVDNFITLKNLLMAAGWRVFRTPLVWINPSAIRAPWPQHGPHRKYQICAYAIKGDKPVTKLYPDVITCASDTNLGWAAQKPVAVYKDLLIRSVSPGDRVLDPFGGSGPILPAAHELKCLATYIEQDAGAYGIAVKRLGELK